MPIHIVLPELDSGKDVSNIYEFCGLNEYICYTVILIPDEIDVTNVIIIFRVEENRPARSCNHIFASSSYFLYQLLAFTAYSSYLTT